jgi:xanthine dehydrogenase YagS FAD-binding subunit
MRPFAFQKPDDLGSAIHAYRPGAYYLAGGTTLLDLMKLDVMRPSMVIDINAFASAHSEITHGPNGLRLGAMARMADVAADPGVRRDYPVIAQSLELAASPQLRNMATLGGNVLQRTRCPYFRDPSWAQCNKRNPGSGCAALNGPNRKHAILGVSEHCIAAYPGDFAQALIALDARVDVIGRDGGRKLRFSALHLQPGDRPDIETTLRPDELIVAFEAPAGAWTQRSVFLKIRDRESYEFALASAAVALEIRNNTIEAARIGLGGVATKPWRSEEAETLLVGRAPSLDHFRAAAEAAFAQAQWRDGNRYKVALGKHTLVRALAQAAKMQV